jgi:hypothetical protein
LGKKLKGKSKWLLNKGFLWGKVCPKGLFQNKN